MKQFGRYLVVLTAFFFSSNTTIHILSAQSDDSKIRIGSKKFTESVILGELSRMIVEQAGLQVEHRQELGGTRILWEALIRGDLDIYPDYTGTIQFEILQRNELRDWQDLKDALQEFGIGITDPIGFNNTYGVGMRRTHAERLGIRQIADLKSHPGLIYGIGHEFSERADGWPGLKNRYQLSAPDLRGMDHDIAYRAIASKAIDVMDVYTTDAEIEGYDLVVLDDNLQYFPRYEAVLLYRLDLAPAAIKQIKRLSGRIDESTMIKLNSAAKLQGQAAPKIAAKFLENEFGFVVSVESSSLKAEIKQRSLEHLYLVTLSLGAAIFFAIPLGLAAYRWNRLGQILLAIVGMIQTIPSLALLVIMIPLLGIGALPALFALFLYSLLPVVRGTYLGFSMIPVDIRETAEALGLSGIARYYRIYWPLALSSVLSGIKTAAVINVGTATLGALIGAGGYGQTILRGIRLDDTNLIMAGAIPAACLALGVQFLFDLIEKFAVSPGLRV